MRLVSKTSYEETRQYWPALKEQQRCAKERRCQKAGMSSNEIPRGKWRCEDESYRRWSPNNEIDDSDTGKESCKIPRQKCSRVW